MEFQHVSVLLKETVDGLNITPDGIYVDGTMGGGGHSREILKSLTKGKLIGFDASFPLHSSLTLSCLISC